MTSNIDDPRWIDAQVQKTNAEVVGLQLDNDLAETLRDTAQIAYNREVDRRNWELASPARRRVYYLTGEITPKSTYALIDTFSRWEELEHDAETPFSLVVCSPGGNVVYGFQMYSFLKGLSERRTLKVSAAGMCASMATVIHQAASPGERYIEPGCSYLLHKVSGQVEGRSDNISDTAAWLTSLNERITEILALNSHKTAAEIDDEIDRRELFLTTDEVLGEWGLADQMGFLS